MHRDGRSKEVNEVIPSAGETAKIVVAAGFIASVFAFSSYSRQQSSRLDATVLEERGTYMTAKNYGQGNNLNDRTLNYSLRVNGFGGVYNLEVVDSQKQNPSSISILDLESLIKVGTVISVPAEKLGREKVSAIYVSDIIVK